MTSLLSLMVRSAPARPGPLEDLLGAPFGAFLPGLLGPSSQQRLQSMLAAPNAFDGATETQELSLLAGVFVRLLSDEFSEGLAHLTLAGSLEDEYALLLVSLTGSSGGRRGLLSAPAFADLAGLLSDNNASALRHLLSRALGFPPLRSAFAAQSADLLESLAKTFQRARPGDLESLRQPVYKTSCLLAALSEEDIVSSTGLYQPASLALRLSSVGRALLLGLCHLYECVLPGESRVGEAVGRRSLRVAYHVLRPTKGNEAAEFIAGVAREAYGERKVEGRRGALFADLLRVYGQHLSLRGSRLEDALATVGELTGLTFGSSDGDARQKQAPSSGRQVEEGAVQTVRAVLGEGSFSKQFIVTCLSFFDNNVERCIDAILTKNLPPALQYLADENLGRGEWRRREDEKDEGYRAGTKSSESDRKHLELQKMRVREAERRAELDSFIVRQEYGDEYDDQFDDALPATDSAETRPVVPPNDIHWEVKLSNIRRHNQLLKEEEREIAFWEDLKLDNKSPILVEDGREEGKRPPDESKKNLTNKKQTPKPTANGSKEPHVKSSKVSEKTESAGDSKKAKYRTKTFDKHHQKEKATKKLNL